MRHRIINSLGEVSASYSAIRIVQVWSDLPSNGGTILSEFEVQEIEPYAREVFLGTPVGAKLEMDDIVSSRTHGSDQPCVQSTLSWQWFNPTGESGWKSFVPDFYLPPPVGTRVCRWRYRTTWINGFFPGSHVSSMPSHSTTVVPPSEECSALITSHLSRCNSLLSERTSLGNFVLELGETRLLLDSAKKLMKKNSVLFDPTDPVLAYNFGIKPLISDIKGIYQSLQSLQKNVDWLLDNNGEERKIRTSRKIPVSPSYYPEDPLPGAGNGQYTEFRVLNDGTNTISMTSAVSYDVGELGRAGATVAAVSRSLGLSNPLKVAWNAIPYSFVVDWFFDVDRLLDKCDLLGLYLQTKVVRTTFHWKVEGEAHFSARTYESPYGGNLCPEMSIGKVRGKFYRRWVGIPPGVDSLFSGLSPEQQALLAALFGQGHKVFGTRRPWFTPTQAWYRRAIFYPKRK